MYLEVMSLFINNGLSGGFEKDIGLVSVKLYSYCGYPFISYVSISIQVAIDSANSNQMQSLSVVVLYAIRRVLDDVM